MPMERSLFTKIIEREIPATIEYEDDSVIAIRDIAPVAPVHILIIPKKPLHSVNSVTPEDQTLVGHVFSTARMLAEKFGIAESGYRVVTNVNNDGGQSVPHLHFHLLGGEPLGRMTTGHVQSTPNAPATSSAPTIVRSAESLGQFFRRTFWRDLAVLVVVAVGLAYGYNELNPKHIAWMRPVYTHDTLSTLDNDPSTAGTTTTASNTIDTSGRSTGTTLSKADSLRLAVAKKDSLRLAAELTAKNRTDTAKAAPSAPCFVAQPGVIKEIVYDQFVNFLSKPCIVLIDARIPESYGKGHVRNAINVNGTEAESPESIGRLIGLPKDKIMVIYCDGGECELSHRVADVLKNFGYGPIYIYTGGWAEWSTKK